MKRTHVLVLVAVVAILVVAGIFLTIGGVLGDETGIDTENPAGGAPALVLGAALPAR